MSDETGVLGAGADSADWLERRQHPETARFTRFSGYHVGEWHRFVIDAPTFGEAGVLARSLGFWLHCWTWRDSPDLDVVDTWEEEPGPAGGPVNADRAGGPGEPEPGGEPTGRWEWIVQVADLLNQATKGDLAELASILREFTPEEVTLLDQSLEQMRRGGGELVRENPHPAGKRITVDEFLATLDDDDSLDGVHEGSTLAGRQFLDDVLVAREDPSFRAEFEQVTREIRLVEERRRALVGWARLLAERETGSPVRPATEEEARAMRGPGWDDPLDAGGPPADETDEIDAELDPLPMVQGFLQPIFDDLLAEHGGSVSRMLNAPADLVSSRHDRAEDVQVAEPDETAARTQRNLFWVDFVRDWEDPEFREEFVRVSRVIAARDARRNSRRTGQPTTRPGRRLSKARGAGADDWMLDWLAADVAAARKRDLPRTVWFPEAMPGELDDLYSGKKPGDDDAQGDTRAEAIAAYLRALDAATAATAALDAADFRDDPDAWEVAYEEVDKAARACAAVILPCLPPELSRLARWWPNIVRDPTSRVAALLHEIEIAYVWIPHLATEIGEPGGYRNAAHRWSRGQRPLAYREPGRDQGKP